MGLHVCLGLFGSLIIDFFLLGSAIDEFLLFNGLFTEFNFDAGSAAFLTLGGAEEG